MSTADTAARDEAKGDQKVSSSSSGRGLLIVFEGLDRSGKSTQCARLAERLQAEGRRVRLMRFPDRSTAIGASIDAYLRSAADLEDHVIHLLFSANRWEAATRMRAELAAGTTLVVDRYSYSGAVYSAAKGNPALPLDWAWQPEIGLPRPDCIFYLTVSEQVAQGRGGFGEERYEKQDMQRRVGALFRTLFDERLALEPSDLNVIDADSSIDAVHDSVYAIAVRALQDGVKSAQPLGTFGALC